MHTYIQETGQWLKPDGTILALGYSGHGEGKNNPLLQSVSSTGPTPQGVYVIGKPFNSSTHGPFVMRIEPVEETNTYGRSGFLIHGDSVPHPGTASLGCIIMPRFAREYIARSGDNRLRVIDKLVERISI